MVCVFLCVRVSMQYPLANAAPGVSLFNLSDTCVRLKFTLY